MLLHHLSRSPKEYTTHPFQFNRNWGSCSIWVHNRTRKQPGRSRRIPGCQSHWDLCWCKCRCGTIWARGRRQPGFTLSGAMSYDLTSRATNGCRKQLRSTLWVTLTQIR